MKNFIFNFVAVAMFLGSATVFLSACSSKAEAKKELTFKVYGNCEMCKNTIETSLKKDKGVESADWNKDTKIMKVAYDPATTNEKEIHHLIASSGYDTELEKANDAAYKGLSPCCQYDRKK